MLEKAAGDTLGKSLVIKELDISKEDSILKFMRETLEAEEKIDVLSKLIQQQLYSITVMHYMNYVRMDL